MKEVTYITDNGYTIFFGKQPPFICLEIEDNFSGNFITSKAPLQDGNTTLAVTLTSGNINLISTIVAFGSKKKSANVVLEEYIELMNYAFNPKIEGTLIVNDGIKSKQIRCRSVAKPSLVDKYNNYAKLDIELIADNPMWESAKEYVTGIGTTYNTLRFPMYFPSSMGYIYNQMKVDNSTRYNMIPIIEVFSTTEILENVIITNETTNKFIEINRKIDLEEKMIIDIKLKKAEIWKKNSNGIYEYSYNATNWLTLDSEWFELVPGENIISINKYLMSSTPLSIIKYRIPYMGVS